MRFTIQICGLKNMQISMLHGRIIDFLDRDSIENNLDYGYKIRKEL